MILRPCPGCLQVPETRRLEGNAGFSTECPMCRGLSALGRTEDESRVCWNGCIGREDFR